MEGQNYWQPNQHVYRKHHSVASALTQVADTIFTAADEKDISAALTVDESSVFDCIDFNILT